MKNFVDNGVDVSKCNLLSFLLVLSLLNLIFSLNTLKTPPSHQVIIIESVCTIRIIYIYQNFTINISMPADYTV